MKIPVVGFLLLLFTHTLYAQGGDPHRNRGLFNITTLSMVNVVNSDGFDTSGHSTDEAIGYSLQTIVGCFLGPYVSVGAGISLDGYHSPNFKAIPLFIDVRAYFGDKENTFFAFFDWGWLQNAGPSYPKGQMSELGVGVKGFSSSNLAVVTSISLKGITSSDESRQTAVSGDGIQGVGLTIGLLF